MWESWRTTRRPPGGGLLGPPLKIGKSNYIDKLIPMQKKMII